MAATDADASYPYDTGSVLESQWRTMASWWLTDGVVRGDLSNANLANTTGRALNVAAFHCWVRGAAGEFTGTTTVNFAANASGNPRIDLVVLRNDFVANKVQIDVLQGTPAGSPTVPAVTQNTAKWEVGIYQVTCANGFTGLTTANAVDVRPYAQGRPAGGPLVFGCAATSSGTTISGGTFQFINFDADIYDTAGMHTPPSGTFTVPVAGLWACHCVARWAGVASTDTAIRINQSSTPPDGGTFASTPPIGSSLNSVNQGYIELPCVVGDTLVWEASQDHGSIVNIIASRAHFRYLGVVA